MRERLTTRLLLVLAGLLLAGPVHADEPEGMSATHILDLNDSDALIALKAMALAGDNQTRLLAEAWLVLSSIALGKVAKGAVSLTKQPKPCGSRLRTASARMEIYELNRVVTSNFRNAERGTTLDKRKLFSVSRQAVILLSDRIGNLDCNILREIMSRSET